MNDVTPLWVLGWVFFFVSYAGVTIAALRSRERLAANLKAGVQISPDEARRDAAGFLALYGSVTMVLPGLLVSGFASGTTPGTWLGWLGIACIVLAFAAGLTHGAKTNKALETAGFPEPA